MLKYAYCVMAEEFTGAVAVVVRAFHYFSRHPRLTAKRKYTHRARSPA